MKPKTFYILAIVCSLSLLSSAKQSGQYCDKKTCCGYGKPKCPKQAAPTRSAQADYNLPTLRLVFGI